MTAPEQLLQADIDAREAALDVRRSFIVQAPAGSGKTELLIQRYLRLLAIVEQPEQVLAITFTRKAAGEMQMRVLQALQRAESPQPPDLPHERVTYEAARTVLDVDRHRQWQLTRNPGRMRILTLDALNASIARTQPLSSASGAATGGIVADAVTEQLYREAATLTLDNLVAATPWRSAAELVLGHVDTNVGIYVDYLARMLATRDQWLPFVGSGRIEAEQASALRGRFEENLRYAVDRRLRAISGAIPAWLAEAVPDMGRYAAQRLIAAGAESSPVLDLSDAESMPAAEAGSLAAWRGIAELLLTVPGGWRRTVDKRHGFPAGTEERLAMLELLAACQDQSDLAALLHGVRVLPTPSYTDEQWEVLLALLQLLPVAVTELKRLFSLRGMSDYTEIALCASEALGSAEEPGDAALLLDYEIRHLLVDEMQDTSSAQYRMLEALTGGWVPGDGRTLFCVGDPMQSIYRFRNAEVGQFLIARREGLGNFELQSLTLRRNFRSGSRLVDWFNHVFPGVMPAVDEPAESAVSYAEAVSVPAKEGQGEVVVHPLLAAKPADEARAGSRLVAELLAANPDDEVAVLVRSRTQLPGLLANLRAAGIAYRAVEIDRLTDLPEIIDLLALTRALVHRGDRQAWLAVLRAPWLGLEWRDLHALVVGAGSATVMESIGDPERIATLSDGAQRVLRDFQGLLAEHFDRYRDTMLRDRVERLWLALGGPVIAGTAQAVDNVYRYLDVLERLESAGTLEDVAELENALDRERISNSGDARVQVMTMHRAKGLQFDHVVLYALGRAAARRDREVLSWFDVPVAHGGDEKIISPIGPRAAIESDPVHRFIETVEGQKDSHETGRMLYVACTRAQRSLHLVAHAEVKADGSGLRRPRAGTLLELLWPAVHREFEAAFARQEDLSGSAEPERWRLPELRRFETPWKLPAAAPLPVQQPGSSAAADSQVVDYYWAGNTARLAGTLVHRWLQFAAEGEGVTALGDWEKLRRRSGRWLTEAGITGTEAASVLDRVAAALERVRSDPRAQWLLSGDGHAELALTGVEDGHMHNVVIDRVRVDSDGTHWIVDYKTSSHEGGGLDTFLEAEVDRYRAQLRRYAEYYGALSGAAVRCALYFPLLQAFVPVSVDA